jgi:DNA polymerase-3 subunit alpha
MIRYAAQKYGADRVAQIVTFSTIKGKQALRDAARVLGHPYGVGDRVAKAMPPAILGREATLEQVLEPPPSDADSTIKDWYANAQGLRDLYDADPAVRETVDAARGLEGLRRQDSIHAAAVVIAPEPLIDIVPIQQKGEGAEVVTQYEMYGVESLGLLKMDFLGLRNLSIIERCLELVEESKGERVEIDSIPLDDPKAFELLQSGNTVGVFQLEGNAMRSLIRSLKPDSFDDVIALVALYRPGPMGANMHTLYADRKNGRAPIEELHPALTDKLADTYQIMVYQEQVMSVAQEMAGYSMVDADNLRRAMGKKIKSVMKAEEDKFVAGCVAQGHTEDVGREIFALIEHFSGYGFNRCLTGDTEVVEAETGALRSLREIYEGQTMPSLASLDGWTRSLRTPRHIWENGIKPVFKLTTRSGRTIRATGNHPFRTVSGWRRLDGLSPGDFVAVTSGHDWVPSASMTWNQLRVLGYVVAEGNTCHPSGFYIYSGDEAVVRDSCEALEAFENSRAKIDRSKSAVSIYAGRLDRSRPSGAVEFIERMGLRQKTAVDKELPEVVYGLPPDQLAQLLAAMWSGDGCCHVSSRGGRLIYYATSSEQLANQVAHLLIRLGIRNTLSTKSFRYRGERRVGYQIHVVTDEGRERFATMIGPFLVGKRADDLDRLMLAAPQKNNFRSTVDQVPAAEVFPLLRLAAVQAMKEAGRSLKDLCESGGFSPRLVQSLDARRTGYRRDTILAMAKAFKSTELRELADADVWWDPVVSIEPAGSEMTYDLEVPDTHNFVANDVVVHNSHSAGYGLVAYQTAYLKAHHPAEYMASLLTATKRDKDRTAVYLNECRQMAIKVLVPDVNESDSDFTVRDGRIRFGLSAVRNVGEGVVERIVAARKDGPFESFHDFVDRVDVAALNKRTVESLIKAGAFDAMGYPRKGLAVVYEQILDGTLERRRNEDMGQFSLFAGDPAAVSQGRIDVPDLVWPQKIGLGFEKEMLGLYVSDHPLLAVGQSLAAATTVTVRELDEMADKTSVTVGGLVAGITRRWTRNGDPMIFFNLEDMEGSVEVVSFPRTVNDYGHLVVEDAVLIVGGSLDHRGDDVKVMAREIKELEIRDDSTVRLKTPAATLTPEMVARLKAILSNHPGPAPVYLNMTSDQGVKVLKLSDAHRVEPRTALFAELKELLGPSAIL